MENIHLAFRISNHFFPCCHMADSKLYYIFANLRVVYRSVIFANVFRILSSNFDECFCLKLYFPRKKNCNQFRNYLFVIIPWPWTVYMSVDVLTLCDVDAHSIAPWMGLRNVFLTPSCMLQYLCKKLRYVRVLQIYSWLTYD